MSLDTDVHTYWEAASKRVKELHARCLRDGDNFNPEIDYVSLPGGYWLPLDPPFPDELA